MWLTRLQPRGSTFRVSGLRVPVQRSRVQSFAR